MFRVLSNVATRVASVFSSNSDENLPSTFNISDKEDTFIATFKTNSTTTMIYEAVYNALIPSNPCNTTMSETVIDYPCEFLEDSKTNQVEMCYIRSIDSPTLNCVVNLLNTTITNLNTQEASDLEDDNRKTEIGVITGLSVIVAATVLAGGYLLYLKYRDRQFYQPLNQAAAAANYGAFQPAVPQGQIQVVVNNNETPESGIALR